MAKKQESSVMKYWPIGVAVIGIAGSFFTLKSEAGQTKERLDSYEVKQEKVIETQSEMAVQQAKLQVGIEQLIEYAKESRQTKGK